MKIGQSLRPALVLAQLCCLALLTQACASPFSSANHSGLAGRESVPDLITLPSSTVPVTSEVVPEINTTVVLDPALRFVSAELGDDLASGQRDAPFATIQRALRDASPGMTIFVEAGEYESGGASEPIIVSSRFTADAPLSLVGSEGAVIYSDLDVSAIRVVGAAHVNLEGFTLRGLPDTRHGTGVFITDFSSDIRVARMNVQGFGGGGIGADNSDRVLVENNVVENNSFASYFQTSGLSSFEAWDSEGESWMIFRQNIVRANRNVVPTGAGLITDGNCVIVDRHAVSGYTGHTIVQANLCIENGGRGVHVLESNHVTVTHNTLVGNLLSEQMVGGGEISVVKSLDVVVANNLVVPTEQRQAVHLRDQAEVEWEANVNVADGSAEVLPTGWQTVGSDAVVFRADCTIEEAYRPSITMPVVQSSSHSIDRDLTGLFTSGESFVGALLPTARAVC